MYVELYGFIFEVLTSCHEAILHLLPKVEDLIGATRSAPEWNREQRGECWVRIEHPPSIRRQRPDPKLVFCTVPPMGAADADLYLCRCALAKARRLPHSTPEDFELSSRRLPTATHWLSPAGRSRSSKGCAIVRNCAGYHPCQAVKRPPGPRVARPRTRA